MSEDKVVGICRPLLLQLKQAKSKSGSSSNKEDLCRQIEDDIDFVKKILISVDGWGRGVQHGIENITKRINVLLEDSGSKDEIPSSEFEAIKRLTSSLKERVTPPVHLSESEFIGSSPTTADNDPDQQFEANESDPVGVTIATVREHYEGLNHYYKHCLKLLLVFPTDSVIKKRTVFYCWMAEHIATNIASEEDGEECLSTLVGMGLITPVFRRHNPRIIYCLRVPPLVRDQLILVSYEEECRSGTVIQMPFDPIDSRPCMSIGEGRGHRICKPRVCFNVERRYLKFEKNRFMEMKRVVAAHLGRWQNSPKHHIEVENTEFFTWLRSFKELRYLSLRGISRITELPPSIGSLYELRILDLRACHNLERLPPEIGLLENLTHLDVSECYLLDRMPDEIAFLSNLRVFKGLVPWNAPVLGILHWLDRLRKLSITIGRLSVVRQWHLDALRGLTSLCSLTLTWGAEKTSPSSSSSTHGILFVARNFTPPPNLQKLDIRCFPETEAPWLKPDAFTELERLYIRGGKLTGLNHSSPWPTVKILRLRHLHDMEVDESHLCRSLFPHLDYLDVYDCKRSSSAI